MAVSDLEAKALEVLTEQGYDTRQLETALALATLSSAAVEIVDDTLACALMGVRREGGGFTPVPETHPQLQIDALAFDCMAAHLALTQSVS